MSAASLATLLVTLHVVSAAAQENTYLPLDQYSPPGRIGRWSAQIGKGLGGVMQPVKIVLPSVGTVTVFNGGRARATPLAAPAQFSVGVGFVYRLKISDLPDLPGVELYPSIEIIDRLHPPAGCEQDFPIPITLTSDDIQAVVDGRMLTKVVYLEQPQLAVTGDVAPNMLNRLLPPDRNLLIEADRVGRPMVLVRLGGRTPSDANSDDEFFGPPAPLQIVPHQGTSGRGRVAVSHVRDAATIVTAPQPRAQIETVEPIRLASRRGIGTPTPPRPQAAFEPTPPPYELFPDEYLFDGGDRGLAVHMGPVVRDGLETEDAVAEYSDHLGNPHLLPTNRVAIYSPRFGNLGTSTGLETGVNVTAISTTVDTARNAGVRNRVSITNHEQRMPSQSVRVRSRANGFEAEEMQTGVKQRLALTETREMAGSVEDVQNQIAPTMHNNLAARIAKARHAAAHWTRNEFPIVTASLKAPNDVNATFVVSEMVGVEDRRKKGRLQIVKLADKQVAAAGEIVTFVIEYENIGDLELRTVRIVDNLTPRLEYITGSGVSDRPAAMNAADNGEGSVVLTWALDGALPGHTKGSVTFKARVR